MTPQWRVSVWLTLIHKDQSELVLGAAVPQLSRVRALVLPRELIKQYLHQTFGLVEVDLTALQQNKQALPHIQYILARMQTDDPRWRADTEIPFVIFCTDGKSYRESIVRISVKWQIHAEDEILRFLRVDTNTNRDTQKAVFQLIFMAFMFIKISARLACWSASVLDVICDVWQA